MNSYDVAVIGSGPGGYVAAIRCAQLGMKTAIIEKYPTLGGTCLNVGCIPSKALLDSSHHYEDALKHFQEHGIHIHGDIKVNLKQMIDRKQAVVDQTTGGIDFLMKKNKIDVYQGLGSFKDANHIVINGKKSIEIEAKNTIIATGSKPSNLPFISIDKERVITSTEALKLTEIPRHLIVIGGGVIGLELGQVYKRLGAEVTVVEYLDRIIPTMDSGLSKELNKVLKKQKFSINVSHKVKSVERIGDEVIVGFVNDDPRAPIVLGALHSGAKPSPIEPSDDNHEKGIVTRSGMKLLFNDDLNQIDIETPNGNTIKISDDSGSLEIKDENGNAIELNSDGITMSSAKDITLNAASGDITIEGININLKASAQFTAEGSAGAEVSTSAIAVLKGSLVQIN